MTPPPLVLVTGASGYIGGRLVSALERRGVRLRCMARRPEFLFPRVAPTTEVVAGDVLDEASLAAPLAGVDTAYYLVHSMGSADSFAEQDRAAARAFASAARAAGVRRIVYLGGLGGGEELSAHLASRQEVGEILREALPTIEFRAGIILGSGSLSFALIRSLVEKLPVMVTPRWVKTPTQPISVEDVVEYLVLALDQETRESVVYEIGGADRATYGELMHEYARQRGLRRLLIPVPLLTPRLSSLWLGLVTPVYARVGRKLIDGLRNATVVEDDRALREFPLRPRGMAAAIERALANEDRRCAETRWSDALSSVGPRSRERTRFGARFVDSRAMRVDGSPEAAFAPIRRIGGRVGWYYATWLWRVRGFFDLLVGGAGMRRGRRDPEMVRPGDPLDFWRVEDFEPDRLLRLRAEMRLPGRAWLQFEVERDADAGATIRQTAIFDPAGVLGRCYWYALWPVHQLVFAGMLRAIVRRGCEASAPPDRARDRSAP